MTDDGLKLSGIGTVILPVSDQDRAIGFYTDKLGLEVRADTPYGENERWVEVAPPGADTTISLPTPREDPQLNQAAQFSGVSFATTDVEADHKALSESGVEVEELMRMGDPVPPMFFFRDSEGNRLLFVERE